MPDANAIPEPSLRPAGGAGRRLLWILAGLVAGLVLGTIFLAYLRPAFLMEVLNLRYCG